LIQHTHEQGWYNVPEKSRGMHRVRAGIQVRLGDSPGVTGHCMDLSMSGMFVEANFHYDVGAIVPVTMLDHTPGGHAVARVVRVTSRGMGLEFTSLPRVTLRKILGHLSHERVSPLRMSLDLCMAVP